MMVVSRTSRNPLDRWWLGTDRPVMLITFFLILIGAVMVFMASPYVADRTGHGDYSYVAKHFLHMAIGIFALIAISFAPAKWIRAGAPFAYAATFVALAATMFYPVVKGSRRWISMMGLSLQPSEIMKPVIAVLTAVLLVKIKAAAPGRERNRLIALLLASYAAVMGVTVSQPDFGMTFTFLAIFGLQVFIAGLPVKWIAGAAVLFGLSMPLAYKSNPHFADRISRFVGKGDTYQVDRGRDAIANSGLLPGGGSNIKQWVPDVHTDFIFSALAEGLGALLALVIVGLYFALGIRVMGLAEVRPEGFRTLAVTGLTAGLMFQVVVNVCSTLGIIPTKGMTLPFISYGGSSFVASCISIGLILTLLRSNDEEKD